VSRLLLCLVLGCGTQPDPICEDFNREMKACFGDQFEPIACDQISRADLVNLTEAAEDLSCEENGWALPIDGDLLSASCRLTGVGCVGAVNELPVFSPANHPVVLVNGIDVSPFFQYSDRIVRTMRELGGHDVHLALDTPYETPQRRAQDLWARIRELKRETGAEKVNLICHSLGGLDCRYLVSPNGLHWEVDASHEEIAGSVASITTVSTAHRGTPIADAALGYLAEGDALDAAQRLATSFGDAFTPDDIEEDVRLRASLQALTTIEAAAFNAQIVDAPGIYYQSWAGFSAPYGVPLLGHDEALEQLCPDFDSFRGNHDHMATPLIPSAEMIDGPSDGLAPVASTSWGELRGCIPADHMEQLGQYRIPDVNVRTGFDIARFYASIAADLGRRGF
jgi:triacylglycerol lipase